jgi:hypothetical protein
LVAATDASTPACRSITCVAVAAIGEPASLVIAIVMQPWARAASSTATTSGEAPDCEMPSTTPSV